VDLVVLLFTFAFHKSLYVTGTPDHAIANLRYRSWATIVAHCRALADTHLLELSVELLVVFLFVHAQISNFVVALIDLKAFESVGFDLHQTRISCLLVKAVGQIHNMGSILWRYWWILRVKLNYAFSLLFEKAL